MVHSAPRIASRALALVTAAAALGSIACASPEREVRVQPAPGEGIVLADAEIADVVMAANTSEVQEGQLALQKSRNNAVREFAQRMVTDHSNLNQRLATLDGELDGMNGVTNPLTQQLATSTRQTLQTLQQLDGAQFDRTYMQNQVEIHEWLLQTLDDALIPSARSSDLEDALIDARGIIASHLQHARQVRASLGS